MSEAKRGAGDAEAAGSLKGSASQFEGGLARGQADDFELQPTDAVADAGAESLGGGLLGGKASGEALGGVALAAAVGDLAWGIDAAEESLAEASDTVRDAFDFN